MVCNYYYPSQKRNAPQNIKSDICIYGATSSGVVAAVQAAKAGKRAVLVEFSNHIGGMTTSGLSATDIGDKHSIGGLTLQFHRSLGKAYGKEEHWFFEPHIASSIFKDWLESYSIPVYKECRLQRVEIGADKRIRRIITEDNMIFEATVYIDASYEGDLMALAGVSYTYGRESNDVYDEDFGGVRFGSFHHNFLRFVDPFRKHGDPWSGLLPGISSISPGKNGDGDKLIQAYSFRLCLTNREEKKVSFSKPVNYDPERYELLRRYIDAGIFDIFNLTIAIPNGKADHNHWGGFNSDNIGANYAWPNGSYEERERIYQDHIDFQKGLFWFLSTDQRLPKKVRQITQSWGLAADEFTDTDNWPPQLYVREARRMVSDYVLTEHDAFGRYSIDDSVGMASYKMDSHNCKRVVKSGRAMNEGNFEVAPINPYPIPYRAIRPKRSECVNLIVPVCISASHIAYCSVRMESVYMILGQSAAIAAALAIEHADGIVQDISYSDLYENLKRENQIIREPEQPPEEIETEGKKISNGISPTGAGTVSR